MRQKKKQKERKRKRLLTEPAVVETRLILPLLLQMTFFPLYVLKASIKVISYEYISHTRHLNPLSL